MITANQAIELMEKSKELMSSNVKEYIKQAVVNNINISITQGMHCANIFFSSQNFKAKLDDFCEILNELEIKGFSVSFKVDEDKSFCLMVYWYEVNNET